MADTYITRGEFEQRVAGVDERIKTLSKNDDRIEKTVDKIESRVQSIPWIAVGLLFEILLTGAAIAFVAVTQ